MIDFSGMKSWCKEVLAEVYVDGNHPAVMAAFASAVDLSEGRRLVQLAEEMAGIADALPVERKQALESRLMNRHGYGLSVFQNKTWVQASRLIANGRIVGVRDYRLVLDLLSDTTLDPKVQTALVSMAQDYESR